MDIETIRRISLARHLFELGYGSLRSKNDLHLFAAVNLVQDAVETFLIALADHLQVAFDQNTKFDKYFVLINEKIAPKELPFKAKLLRLNRVRVDSKHHGIQPARDECVRLTTSAREFMDEASVVHFGAPFATISTLDLLDDSETSQHLIDAKTLLEASDFEGCIISCRKAVYIEIEKQFDISAYKDGEPQGLLALMGTSAPYYARSKDYIKNNVRVPTDYIVLDHAIVDRELLTKGVNPTDFWNVWRLTPEVYKKRKGNWIVKQEFSKLDQETVAEIAEYVFSTTLDIALAIHSTRRAMRWQPSSDYYIELSRPQVPIYEQANRQSKLTAITPKEMTRVNTDYSIIGLNDDGPYWYVRHYEEDLYFRGFIHNDDIKL